MAVLASKTKRPGQWASICAASFDGYFVHLNPAWTRVLGFDLEELLTRPLVDFVHPDAFAQLDADQLAGHNPSERRHWLAAVS